MSSFALKKYQTETLRVLREYLDAARIIGAKPAYDGMKKAGVRAPRPYRPLEGLPAVPYVCLRLPTGGGKTLLSAHSVKVAAETYLEREFPVVLWLVPTNTIRKQTLETLKKPGNPNYETLRTAFDGRFRVFDITDFTTITPSDVQTQACVIVGTIQTLRTTNTDGRKVYAHNENLEPHFSAVPDTTPGLERIEDGEHKGQVKFSFRNLLAVHRPLVIVDEAHNNTSALSYEVLERINAACVVEFTATPAEDSNVLHGVSATELKAEEMIKLPIRLLEHKSWEEAVRDSILTRKRLHALAEKDADYIRPIVLFQAEEKGREVTQDVLVKHLTEQENIPRGKIAVVTGDQKELDGINLFARDCEIDFVVTVEALKEGWDCSFAYVFCSAANVNSKKDVEQILGRVLRMPYAKKRSEPELNRAYAHVSKASWPNAVSQLHDRLVDMGFEDAEADSFIEKVPDLGLDTPQTPLFAAEPPQTIFELAEDISAFALSPQERATLTIEKTEDGSRITFTGDVNEETLARVSAAVTSAEARASLQREAKRHKAVWQVYLSPAQRKVPFSAPQLCFELDGELEVADKNTFLDATGWNLLDYPTDIPEADFRLSETGIEWEIDLSATGKLTERAVGQAEQQNLDLIDSGWTTEQFCQWLERKTRQPDVTQPVMLEYIRRAVAFLIEKRGFALSALVRWRFILAKVLLQRIGLYRDRASATTYQQTLFGPQAAVETSFSFAYDFASRSYAPHWTYVGHPYQFQKHYYAAIGELDNKGEEYECAKAIDMTGSVKHWVRNLERRCFSLPLAKGNFYPDFFCELTDGRVLAIEHKGKVYASNDDSKEKNNIGALWEKMSGGKALYLMTIVAKDLPPIFEQIAAKIR